MCRGGRAGFNLARCVPKLFRIIIEIERFFNCFILYIKNSLMYVTLL